MSARVGGIPLLVLGVGNPLHRDDGLGLAALSLLTRRWRAPEGVRILDGGTLGAKLLPWVAQARALIVVDAAYLDQPPGTLVRITARAEVLYAEAERLGLQDAGDLALPLRLSLLGIVPEQTGVGLRRSRVVEQTLPALVDSIVAEAAALGFRFLPSPATARAPALSQAEGG
ncbi:MAG TPA: hydrogenase maturation protease [Myxococcales bacterium]|nr:hydrogenase maturation protease [Myxococcales bacterium]